MPFADHDGLRLYYERHGRGGTPLLMIMGLGGTVEAWGMQLPAFAAEREVLLLDNRDVGRSDAADGGYTIEAMADDAVAVLDHADVDRAHVLGTSMGGLIAQALHHRHPRRVASLALACTGPPVNDPGFTPPAPEVNRILSMDRGRHGRRAVLEATVGVFYHEDYRRRVPDLVDRLMRFEEGGSQSPAAYHRQLAAIFAGAPADMKPDAISVNCLILHGAEDAVWSPDNARELARRIPRAELVVIPGAGHMAMIEKARSFNRAVLRFLRHRSESP